MTPSLPILLRQLRLPTMAACCQDVTQQALDQGWSVDQALACLCEYELSEREQRRLQRHLKESRLPSGKTLAAFDLTRLAPATRQRMNAIIEDGQWVSQSRNLLLFGASGLGKSHLAAALGHSLIDRGIRVRYWPASALVQELQTARQNLQLNEALIKLDKYRLLIIDDIGYVKRSEAETSVLFELIAHRYESGSLAITSNHPFSAWDSIFPDSMMAVAAVDRLVHHADIIELVGDSYRTRKSASKQEVATTP